MEEIICCECGSLVTQYVDKDELHYCAKCWKRKYHKCQKCGNWHPVDEWESVKTGLDSIEYWCKDCVTSESFLCEKCIEYCAKELFDGCDSEGNAYCEDCFPNIVYFD